MKNAKVSTKLFICLALMIFLTLVICVLGFFGMRTLNMATTSLYDVGVGAIEHVANFQENFQEQRVYIQELTLIEGNAPATEALVAKIEENKVKMAAYMDSFETTILGSPLMIRNPSFAETNQAQYTRLKQLYNSYFIVEVDRILADADAPNKTRIKSFITDARAAEMSDIMDYAFGAASDLSKWSVEAAGGLYVTLRNIIIIAMVLCLGVSTFFAIYLPRNIATPLKRMVKVADAVAVGDMEKDVRYDDRKDEVGRLASAFDRMKVEITKQIAIVESLANADVTVDPMPRSDKDTLGYALVKLADSMNALLEDVMRASDDVASGAREVAAQSQALAQGSTEQSASVEQLSSAFFEISLNTKESATLAGRTAELTDGVKTMAVDGERLMEQMIRAVNETDAASKDIDKIIRVIEDISFQTNMLALNAAVEAARAGQNGSGFAVVASEVRSLASKSAASAKETGVLIAKTMEKVQLSAELTRQTSASFKQIVDGILESTRLVSDIAKSSEEQAQAIEQINTGISQVAQIIHLNSDAAEKCAEAADRMSEQARRLEGTVSRFHTRNHPRQSASEGVREPAPRTASEGKLVIDLSPSIPTDGFGKY